MSGLRILRGVAIGGCFLAIGFVATWYWSLSLWLAPVLLLGAGIFASIRTEMRRAALLQPYWSRGCMGIRWRRRFATSSKADIRRFLDFFLDAFGFPAQRRTCFSPDDKILDVYRALYPPGDTLADCMEIETFALSIQEHYGVDLVTLWRDDVTLGELFAHATQRS